ncbi:MAG: hypothetical protein AAF960_17820 [Bacteroidota bacterium]
MESLLYTATPTREYTTIMLSLLLTVALLVFVFLLSTDKLKNIKGAYRQIGQLLGGLLGLIALVTTLFSVWNAYTIQPVRLYETYMESFHGKTLYKDIKRAGIFNDKERSFINSQVTIREDNILAVEKRDKSVILFADDNYDLEPLIKKIQERLADK